MESVGLSVSTDSPKPTFSLHAVKRKAKLREIPQIKEKIKRRESNFIHTSVFKKRPNYAAKYWQKDISLMSVSAVSHPKFTLPFSS
ncbi:MAG: hypothetical protein IJL34_09385 [Treponema sp.]|nr:hypothetical protein [Treponema sp.]